MADDIQTILKERLAKLPPAVQRAILSTDIAKEMRALADRNKLHLDQWQRLENEVQMTLLGVEPITDLQRNIEKEVGVTAEVAHVLTEDIMRIVFEPTREELERELGSPLAHDEEVSDVEKIRAEVLAQGEKLPAASSELPENPPESSKLKGGSYPLPSTPPPPAPSIKVERGPSNGAYKPGEPSIARTNVTDDPYREPPQ